MEKKTRVAVVTGGSNGIGNAIAEKFAYENVRVTVADVFSPAKEHENITYHFCDVAKGADVDNLYGQMTRTVGVPDILVLNAGKGIHELLAEGDPEKWQQVIDLNIMGALRCIRAFVPPMLSNKRGDVVFISSVASGNPYPYGGIYGASKTALDTIAETLRLETAPFLRVIVIQPGIVNTNFFNNSGRDRIEMERSLSPKDIADDVWYAINKREGTVLNTIVTRPQGQVF